MLALATRTQYDVPSETEPGLLYVVTIPASGTGHTCTCPDFTYRRRTRGELCKHIHGVLDALGQDTPSTYRRVVTLDLTSQWQLDEDDLADALRAALNGIGVRVELAETRDTTWAQVTVRRIAGI